MTREEMSARWRARWQGLRGSGLKMSEYAQREGFSAPSAYRWLRKARRSGQWSEDAKPGHAVAVAERQPVQFARVAVSDAPATRSSILLRLVLTNGRRAELEIAGTGALGEVLDVLERRV